MAYRGGRTSFLQRCGQYLDARDQGDAPILVCIQAALIVLNRLFIIKKKKTLMWAGDVMRDVEGAVRMRR